jgi:hypothetical protein
MARTRCILVGAVSGRGPLGFGAWLVSALSVPGPPRWPRRCSRRSPWPPFRHRANPGRPARIKVRLAPIVPCLVVASSYDP